MDDREVVAAIAAGDPAGIAAAYDRYADALYGYCHWMLRQPEDAADAMVGTFVTAAAALGGLPEAPKLRPWLYAVARKECLRRLRARSPVRGEKVDAARQPAADRPANVGRDPGQAELRTLILAILAELKPREREVIELTLRHDLYDADLAVALDVSWSRAHALASHALGHLEKALGTLLVACAGREACPALDTLLADWDGQLTKQTRELVGGHISQCKTCADRKRGTLRPAALTGLLPQAALSPGLREKVLRLCSGISRDTVAYQPAESMRPARSSQVSRLARRGNTRGNTRPARATMVLVVWIVALWVVGLTLFIFSGFHPSRALTPQSAVRTLPNSLGVTTAPATSGFAAASASPTVSPSPTASPSPHHLTPPVGPSAPPTVHAEPSPSRSPSPKPSKSASPKPSKSPSPSPSPSRKPSPSPSPSSPRPSSPAPSTTA